MIAGKNKSSAILMKLLLMPGHQAAISEPHVQPWAIGSLSLPLDESYNSAARLQIIDQSIIAADVEDIIRQRAVTIALSSQVVGSVAQNEICKLPKPRKSKIPK